jgi:hypothetical protein
MREYDSKGLINIACLARKMVNAQYLRETADHPKKEIEKKEKHEHEQ